MGSTGISGVICLRSDHNNKYLRYLAGGNQSHGLVQYSANKPIESFTRFEVVPASTNNSSLVHIKSRYSDKYLVRWSPNTHLIGATSEEPNEDQGNSACTLFRPVIMDYGSTKKVRLVHVQSGRYATCYWKSGAPWTNCLYAGSKDVDCDSCDVVTIIDWASVSKLPKLVAFRGDNGRYIGAYIFQGKTCFQFSYTNPYDDKVGFEIFPNKDGTVYIKSTYNGRFLRLSPDKWIVADIDPSQVTGNVSALFRPNVLDLNVFAFLNISKYHYIKRLHRLGPSHDLLAAYLPDVDKFSHLTVKDLTVT